MKFAVAFAFSLASPSVVATDAWGSDACEYDSDTSVSLLQKHVRAGTASRKNPKQFGGDDVGAIAQALTSEIDDVLEQAVDDEALGRSIAKSMAKTKSQINGMQANNNVDAAHKSATSKEDAPTLVVDVPVVKVLEVPLKHQIPIVVEEADEDEDEENKKQEDGEDEEEEVGDEDSHESDVSDSCMAALEKLLTNPKKVDKARKCEEKKGHSDAAIEALQDMDSDLAVKHIEKTFHECGRISKKCSIQLAPEEMLKIRLSGVTMEQKCADIAAEQDMEPNSKTVACQMEMGQDIVKALMKGDVEVALNQAQDGLSTCNKIKHPCDFQLAPLLVGQLIQSQEEQGPQQEPLQPGGMLLGPTADFSTLVDTVIRPSYYQAMLLQE